MDQLVVVAANRNAAVEVGFPARLPGVAVVDLGDAVPAAGEGAPPAPPVPDSPPLGGVPIPGLAADVEDFAGGAGDDAHQPGVAGQLAGGFAADGVAAVQLG